MKKPSVKKRVMVFGVFDGLHPGHISFLKQAKGFGDKLIVGVPSSRIVRLLKNKTPRNSAEKRRKAVMSLGFIHKAVVGDEAFGTYNIIKKHRPHIICLGHDQHELKKDLEKHIKLGSIPKIRLIKLKPHFPKKFKTSILEKLRKQ